MIVLSLGSDVRTHDTHANGTRVTTHHRDDRVLHQETRVVWQSSPPVAPASLSEKQREALSDTPATLSIPFTFYLPEGLPASCAKIDKYDVSAEIAYHIKCTAERPGWFKSNRRSQYRFQYLPPQPFSHKLREMMASGDWLGEWRFTHGSKAVKKNWLFGSEGSVKAGVRSHNDAAGSSQLMKSSPPRQIQLPALDMYPLFTSIPVIVTVQTLSKLLDHEFVTVKEPLFPEPPASLADILLFVENQIQVRVPRHKDRASWRVADVPGFGTAVSQGKLHLQRAERVWVPDEADPSSGKGRWRQEVRATAQVRFDGPPTFETENFTFVVSLDCHARTSG